MSEPLVVNKWVVWHESGGFTSVDCTIVKGLICRTSEFTHLIKTSSSDSTFLQIEINLLECKNF